MAGAPAKDSAEQRSRARWRDIPVRAVRPQRLYEQIAEQIRGIIAGQDLKPGDRLPPERELAQRLEVSRPSVREAMIALETAGIIEVRTGDGTYVRRLVPEGQPTLPWATQSEAVPGTFEQFQARKLVEPELTALAAEAATPEEIDALHDAVERAAALFARGEDAEVDDYLFHTLLAECSRNSVLAGLVRHLWDLRQHPMWKTARSRIVKPVHRQQVVKDRRAIVAALRRRDAEGARAAMRAYLANAEKRFFD